jgi:hypothetical protein
MAQGDRGTLGLVKIASPALTIGGIQSWGLTSNLARQVEGSGGIVDPTFVALMSLKPTLTFTTLQLTALNSCGIAGCQVTTADFYVQKLAPYGTRAGAGSHTKLSAGAGIMVPRTLTASRGQRATIEFEVIPISADGAAPAVEITPSQNLPGGGTVGEAFTIGPAAFNGTGIDVERITVNFGLAVQAEGSGGQPYDTFVSVMDRRPSISISSPDLDAIATVGLEGLAQTAGDSLLYFRQLAANGMRWAEGENKHVKISLDDGLLTMDSVRADHNGVSMAELTYTPTWDGSIAIMVVTVNTPIV